MAEALVIFHPVNPPAAASPKPVAYTDAGGHFSLTTLQPGDGAPLGEYRITVELRELRQVGEEAVRDGPNLLSPQWADPNLSGLNHTVVSGENIVPAIEVGRQ